MSLRLVPRATVGRNEPVHYAAQVAERVLLLVKSALRRNVQFARVVVAALHVKLAKFDFAQSVLYI